MTSPVNLPKNGNSPSAESTQTQSSSSPNKRSAPSRSSLVPNHPPEIVRAAPSLNTNNSDQVLERPAKMQRRGAMSAFARANDANLQPSQSSIARATDELTDFLAGANLKDAEPKK